MTQTTKDEGKFLREIINVTTGWRLEGCKDQEEALRMIQARCEDRLWSREGMPG